MTEHTYTLTQVQLLGDDVVLELNPSDEHGGTEYLTVTCGKVLESLVELMMVYHLIIPQDPNPLEVLSDEVTGHLKEVFESIAISRGVDEFTVSTPNGDTHENVFGHGRTVARALADLARSQGYVTTIHRDGTARLSEWITEFNYGLERRSRELLSEEIQEIVNPDIGSW